MPPPPLPRHHKLSKPSVEVYSAGGWRHAHTNDEGVALSTLDPPQARNSYMMSGALQPRQSYAYALADVGDRHEAVQRRRQAQEPYSEEIYSPLGPPVQHHDQHTTGYHDRHLPIHEFLIDRQTPVQEFSRSLAMQQSFTPAPARGHLSQRDSGYHLIANGYNAKNRASRRDLIIPSAVQPSPHGMAKAKESSFSHADVQPPRQVLQTPMMTRSMPHPQPEQLVPGFGRMRMDVVDDTPRKSRSLNALSFIQEPYTQTNKPVYTSPTSRAIWSRAAANTHAQDFPMQHIQNRTYLPGPRVSPSRGRVAPSYTNKTRQLPSRNPHMQLDGFRGVKGSSLLGPSYNNNRVDTNSNTQRFPYQQQQRGLYTANGRRSVRR